MTARGVLVLLVAVAAGCLRVAPPKTPNQRAAERAAPKVDVPPPPPQPTPRPAPPTQG
jgi:hypothetical protein